MGRYPDFMFGDTGDSIRLMQGSYKRFNTTGSRRSFRDESEGPSIPSQFQTVVIDNSEKPGFASRSRRFDTYKYVTDAPGPGAYSSIDKKMICKSASESKKGSGTFASKSRRKNLFGVDPNKPGPGSYDTAHKPFLSHESDFNRAPYTATFAQPIALPTESKDVAPPPNAYEIKRTITTNSGAGASFKSTTKRSSSFIQTNTNTPAPNQYDSNKNYLLPLAPQTVSSFKSNTKRDNASKAQLNVPGPGSYEPYEKPDLSDIKRVQMPKKHYLCISAPAMPLPKPPPSPGPAAYELPSGFPDAEGGRRYMQSSFFLSNTGRAPIADVTTQPGPATYKPQAGQKQSFFYNSKGIWVG